MTTPRPHHFEILADNVERAEKFYKTTFGWKFDTVPGPSPYWLITTGDDDTKGINGGLMPAKAVPDWPRGAFICTVSTKALDADLKKITANGGTIVAPKRAVPTMGWVAYCKDTEGNVFGVWQEDKNAK